MNTTEIEENTKFITTSQLSEVTNIPVYTIRKLVREGRFPAYKVTGKSYLFDVNEIIDIIRSHKAS